MMGSRCQNLLEPNIEQVHERKKYAMGRVLREFQIKFENLILVISGLVTSLSKNIILFFIDLLLDYQSPRACAFKPVFKILFERV